MPGEVIASLRSPCRAARQAGPAVSASPRLTDGAVIGSRGFVNEAFSRARERFGQRRKGGAHKLRGSGAAAAAGMLWSVRDLKKEVG